MVTVAKVAAKVGWTLAKKFYKKIMELIGQGWTVDKIEKFLKKYS